MNFRLNWLVYGVGLLSLGVMVADAPAQSSMVVSTNDPLAFQGVTTQGGEKLSGDRRGSNEKRPVAMDQERRAALFVFVKDHHPELTRLLKSLEKSRPRQFEVAMRSLSNSYQRLETLQSQGKTKQYEAALEQWKLSSRIKLAAAQVAVKDTPPNRRKLETLIARQYDSRMEALVAEQGRLRERLERVSDLLKKQTDRQLEIERTLDTAMRTASRNMQRAKNDRGDKSDGTASKKSAKPAEEQKGKKTNRDRNRKSGKENEDGSDRK
ncbi:MAG: hypothetical protein MK108_09665 [Mariniblastus sp.]|nr:hypothetical protein [Mariniblastus sp.]